MGVPSLIRVVPTDRGDLALEFGSGDVRLFRCSPDRLERDRPGADWSFVGWPEPFKHLTFDAGGVRWPGGRELDADYLYAGSEPLDGPERERAELRVAYRNQAPTPQHRSHHVYYVYVRPFAAKPFLVGESINGGHAEMGGAATFAPAELRVWPGWREHFALAGCGWAVPLVEADGDERACVDAIVREVCRRADTDESDTVTYEAKGRRRG